MNKKYITLCSLLALFVAWFALPLAAEETQQKKLNVIQDDVSQRFALKPIPRRGTPYPILLVHGFMGFNRLGGLNYFFRVKEYLLSHGEEVHTVVIPPLQGVEERGLELAKAIDDLLYKTWSKKVHLIAHSQGGIDGRYVISAMGYEGKIASLITIAAPHQGTPLADYILEMPKGTLDSASRIMGWLLGQLETQKPGLENAKEGDTWKPRLDRSLQQLSRAGMKMFNEKYPGSGGVPVYSIAGVSGLESADEICQKSQWGILENVDVLEPLLWSTGALLSDTGPKGVKEPNDGVVTTRSMVWGEFLGCVPADHFDQVGQIADIGANWVSGFDHLDFYYRLTTFIREKEKSF